jgi:hypothetical protein
VKRKENEMVYQLLRKMKLLVRKERCKLDWAECKNMPLD